VKKFFSEVTGLFVFLISLGVYTTTLCPTVAPADSGEFIAAAATLGIPHEPGYPLYTVLARLFIFIPAGSIAFRVNIFSAFFSGLTVYLLYLLLARFVQSKTLAFAASLCFAFSGIFWSQSLITEVYALNAFFLALIIYLLLRSSVPGFRILCFSSFLFGLSLSNHQLMILLLPGILFMLFGMPPVRRQITSLRFLLLVLLALTGFSFNLYLLFRAGQNPYLNFGDPETPVRFIKVLARYDFGTFVSRTRTFWNLNDAMFQMKTFFKVSAEQLTWTGCLISLAGLVALFRKNTGAGIFVLLGLVFYGPVFILWSNITPDGMDLDVVKVFYIPWVLISGFCLGIGMDWLYRKLKSFRPILIPVFFYLFIFIFAGNVTANDWHENYFCCDYGKNVLETAKKDSIILVKGDSPFFTLLYFQLAEKRRQDIKVLGLPAMISDCASLQKRWYDLSIPEEYSSGYDFARILTKYNISRYPVYIIGLPRKNFGFMIDDYRTEPVGLLLRLWRKSDSLPAASKEPWKRYVYRGIYDSTLYDQFTNGLLSLYATAHSNLGLYAAVQKNYKLAKEEFLLAVRAAPYYAEAYYNFGATSFREMNLPEAEKWFKKALDADEKYSSARMGLSAVYEKSGGKVKAGKTAEKYRVLQEKKQKNVQN